MQSRTLVRSLVGLLAAACILARSPTPAETREANLKVYSELLRKEARGIFKDLMELTVEQDAKFWQTVDKITKAVGPVAALRFLEIESQADLQANAGLPVVE